MNRKLENFLCKATIGAIGLGIIAGTIKLGEHNREIKEQETRRANQIVQYDANKDGLVDLVDGNGFIRLQQRDGSYLTLEEAKQKDIAEIDNKYKLGREKVRNSVDNLDYEVNRYVVGGEK